MQGKSLYTILLSIIAVLTLALAVLIIFIFTTLNSTTPQPAGGDGIVVSRVVAPEEMAEFKLCGSVDENGKAQGDVFNIKSTDDHPSSFIMASVSIIYDGGDKNALLEQRKALLEKTYSSELKQATIDYFRNKTFNELQAPGAMQEARDTLKDSYCKIIGEDSNIILKVVFGQWLIQ